MGIERKYLALAIAAEATAGAAHGESVKMTGTFVAEAREVAMQRSIAIGRFDGRDGPAFELALERALTNGNDRASPYFAILAPGRGRADAVVSGAVSTGVQDSNWTKTEQKCAEKDAAGKCIRKEDVKTSCKRRIIDFSVDLRVAGDRLLYSIEKPRRDEITWCQGQQPARTVETAVRTMISEVAFETARAFVPQVSDYSVRFRESTKGLPKEFEKPFKATVKQSQRDLRGACASWGDIDARAPGHPSVLFDLGLCAEAAGDYPRADDYYRRAAPLMSRGNEAEEGLNRIDRLVAAREDEGRRGARR